MFFSCWLLAYFYPRSPCGERLISIALSIQPTRFLSTLSLRRATPRGGFCYLDNIISIHALLAESDKTVVHIYLHSREISIHALLAESDTWQRGSRITYVISIHALLAESDIDSSRAASFQHHFYPRSPCGERRNGYPHTRQRGVISIHALLAESDIDVNKPVAASTSISIHALLAESDSITITITCIASKFLSTLSLRRATRFQAADIS